MVPVHQAQRDAAQHAINDEVGILFASGQRRRCVENRTAAPQSELTASEQPGKASDVAEKDLLMKAAQESRSPLIVPALTLAMNAGMRDGEIRQMTWAQIDFSKGILTVGKSKTGQPVGDGPSH